MPRRSYDQYCSIARALDAVGDRWALLVVRELLAGPRRYTDLHADLPGISTDVLATRLKELERDEVVTRRRQSGPGSVLAYELSDRGQALVPVLAALAAWGAPLLAELRAVDAVRAHWAAIPLLNRLPVVSGVLEVRIDEGVFHLRLGAGERSFADGPAPAADARLTLETASARALMGGTATVAEVLQAPGTRMDGDGPLIDLLRGVALLN
jgi:DNA-binding HxlR family transcriptional regulator